MTQLCVLVDPRRSTQRGCSLSMTFYTIILMKFVVLLTRKSVLVNVMLIPYYVSDLSKIKFLPFESRGFS